MLPCPPPHPPHPHPHPPPQHPNIPADVLVQPLLFLSIYSSMTLPAAPFLRLYAVGVLVCFYCTSAGTLLSLVAPPSSALMATTALLMVRRHACMQAATAWGRLMALAGAAGPSPAAAVQGPPNPQPLRPPRPPARPQIMGGMLNGVSPNYRGMAPALRALTALSYNRCAALRFAGGGAAPMSALLGPGPVNGLRCRTHPRPASSTAACALGRPQVGC